MPAAPVPFGRISMSGALAQGEVWECGFAVTGSAVQSQSAWQTEVDAIGTSLAANLGTSFAALNGQDFTWTSVKGYYYDQGDSAARYVANHTLSVTGGSSNPSPYPLQVALVASLRSATPTRNGRGRMYLPATQPNGVSGHQATQSTITTVSGGVAGAFKALQSAGQGWTACILSYKRGIAYPVTSVVVDSRFDVQRRRAAKESVLLVAVSPVTSS